MCVIHLCFIIAVRLCKFVLIPEPVIEIQTPQLEPETAHIPANEPNATEPPPSLPVSVGHSEPMPEPQDPVETEPTQHTAPATIIAPVVNLARDLAVKARAVIQSRKRKKLDKILILLDSKKHIGNDDVEKLLRVSDATATRYLTQLEKEGKIIQVGRTGKSVQYVRT